MIKYSVQMIGMTVAVLFLGLVDHKKMYAKPVFPFFQSHALIAINDAILKAPGNPNVWVMNIPLRNFEKISKFSGDKDYYTIISSDTGLEYFHSHYIPSNKVVRYGYQIPDSLRNITQVSWLWRVSVPPSGADERVKGINDSGCAVYLIFKDKMYTYCIKYVYSSIVPEGTIIRRDPALYPLQQMYLVVANTSSVDKKNQWMQVSVDVCSDFRKIYKTKKCPELKGLGILSDGDGTNSEVIADYAKFTLTGIKK